MGPVQVQYVGNTLKGRKLMRCQLEIPGKKVNLWINESSFCRCDVTDLSQAFSQRPGPGRLWISLSALFTGRFRNPKIPKIDTRYFTQANNPKTCDHQTKSV